MADFLSELYIYMMARKKFWLIPILLMLLALGGIIFMAQGSALSPFVYTIF